MPTTTLSNEEILEAIGNKTVVELAELIEAFKTKFNVTIAAAAAAPAAGGGGGGAAPAAPAEEKTEWTVVLKEGVSKAEAEEIKKKLEEQGAVVELK